VEVVVVVTALAIKLVEMVALAAVDCMVTLLEVLEIHLPLHHLKVMMAAEVIEEPIFMVLVVVVALAELVKVQTGIAQEVALVELA
jgi:hypothetical protein